MQGRFLSQFFDKYTKGLMQIPCEWLKRKHRIE